MSLELDYAREYWKLSAISDLTKIRGHGGRYMQVTKLPYHNALLHFSRYHAPLAKARDSLLCRSTKTWYLVHIFAYCLSTRSVLFTRFDAHSCRSSTSTRTPLRGVYYVLLDD